MTFACDARSGAYNARRYALGVFARDGIRHHIAIAVSELFCMVMRYESHVHTPLSLAITDNIISNNTTKQYSFTTLWAQVFLQPRGHICAL